MESLRIFGHLLHKSWLVRKRHWFTTLVVQIVLPLVLIMCIQLIIYFNKKTPLSQKPSTNDKNYKIRSLEELTDDLLGNKSSFNIAYTPENKFLNALMAELNICFNKKTKIQGFDSESASNEFTQNNFDGSSGVSLVFDESSDRNTKHLHCKYKEPHWLSMVDMYNPLENPNVNFELSLPTEVCLTKSFIKIKSNNTAINFPQTFVQGVFYQKHLDRTESISGAFNEKLFLAIAFTIPMLVEIWRTKCENLSGINVLMSMNGISNTLNLLSWIISGLFLLIILCIVSITLLFTVSTFDHSSFLSFHDPLILFFIFIPHMIHKLTFSIHVSSHFSKPLTLTFVLTILKILEITLCIQSRQSNHNFASFIGIIVPDVLLYQSLQQLRFFEIMRKDAQWHDLFVNLNRESIIPSNIGITLLSSGVGTIIHFILAIYIHEIKPGKYGIGKDLLFFLKFRHCKEKSNKLDNLVYANNDSNYFETPLSELDTPGIQIRNLTKTFVVNFFNKEKVHALRGVSIDFYKGKTTALLGHNGAGKSTLMSILTGMIRPTDGLVLINSKNLKTNACEVLKDMGLCAQEDMYFLSLTVREQLEFFTMVKKRYQSKSSVKNNVEDLMKKLKLFNLRDNLPHSLSEDQKRKLCLGIALAGEPCTLILDEPTSRLDHESRRLVWDILLEMKGKTTILVSTHNMEEADILGDRIAIIKDGQLKSYGTSLFLKKMIALQHNIECTLSVERWSYPEGIRAELHSEAVIVNEQDGKVVVSIPNTAQLSDSLGSLEKKKEKLGISDYSLSLASLEQVFLKITQENDDSAKPYQIISNDEKVKSNTLLVQTIKALFVKKMIYTFKNFAVPSAQVLAVFFGSIVIPITIIYGELLIHDHSPMITSNYIKLRRAFHTSSDKNISAGYKRACQSIGIQSIEITNANLINELTRWAEEDIRNHDHFIIGAEFNRTQNGFVANALYSPLLRYSQFLSVHLIWKAIMSDNFGPDHDVKVSFDTIPYSKGKDIDFGIVRNPDYMITTITTITFCFVLAMFTVHPSHESSSGMKHLQKITGVSGFTYWTTMFLFDLMQYTLIVVLFVIFFQITYCFLDYQLYEIMESVIMMMLLILLALNALPLAYIVSFAKMKISTKVKLLTLIAMSIVISVPTILSQYKSIDVAYESISKISIALPILMKSIASLPHAIFFDGLSKFNSIMLLKEKCRRLSRQLCYSTSVQDFRCAKECQHEKLNTATMFFNIERRNLTTSVIYLSLTSVCLFGILAILETQFIQKILVKYVKQNSLKTCVDEQVLQEKQTVLRKIQSLRKKKLSPGDIKHDENIIDSSDSKDFLVFELRKHYKKVMAVEDVSIGVNPGKCFGLLGVNRAGKSTTFQMMTGEVVPDHGTMYIGDKSFENHKKHFLSQIGYCSQYDATLKCLNSYDHLRLFARLRGIPKNKVESEVEAWIERINLSACASLPSSTYSSGNKQRLNLAITMIGNPELILLDEPTIGIDPGARHSFWNTILSCQMSGQTVVLATHDMSECEAVCNRMAVMADGQLVCIGVPEEIKKRFGAGYDIQIRLDASRAKTQLDKIKKDMRLLLHCVLTNENPGHLMYQVSGVGTTWKKIYNVMNKLKKKYECIDDFLVLVRLSI